uniref:RNA2 polyprotein n=1 Tax=Grapevine fabavirus 2 TaxID=3115799 RepID=A0AAT9J7T7_9SECO
MVLTGTALQVRDFLRVAEQRLFWVDNARFPPGYTMPRMLMKIPWKGDIFDSSQLVKLEGYDSEDFDRFKRAVFADHLEEKFVKGFFDRYWNVRDARVEVHVGDIWVVHANEHLLAMRARVYIHSAFAEMEAVKKVLQEYPNWKFLESYSIPAQYKIDTQLSLIVEKKVDMLARRLGVALNSGQKLQEKVESVYRHVLHEDLPSYECALLDSVVDFLDQHRSVKKEIIWSSDVMDVLIKQMRNFYARLVKLDYSLEPNLESFSDWTLEVGLDSMIRNCSKAVKLYDILLRFVNACIDYLDGQLSAAVKGNVKPVYLRPLQETLVTSENVGRIMQDLEMRLKVMEGTISAIESVVVYDKRRDIANELTVEHVAERIANVVQTLDQIREVLVASGVKVPKFQIKAALPRLRAFGWVPEVVSQLLSHWQNILTAVSLVDSLIDKVKSGWQKKLPAAAFVGDSLETVGASASVPLSEAVECCWKYLMDVLSFLKGEQTRDVEAPIHLQPNPDGTLPPQYGFFDDVNPFVTPGTSAKVEELANWIATTGYKKGEFLKSDVAKCLVAAQWVGDVRISGKDFQQILAQLSDPSGDIVFPRPDAIVLPALPVLKPPDIDASMEGRSMTMAIVHWKRYIDNQLGVLASAINADRERDNELDRRCAQLGGEVTSTNKRVNGVISRLEKIERKPGLIIPENPTGGPVVEPDDETIRALRDRVLACEKTVGEWLRLVPAEGFMPAMDNKLRDFYREFSMIKQQLSDLMGSKPSGGQPLDDASGIGKQVKDLAGIVSVIEKKVVNFPEQGFDLIKWVKDFAALTTAVTNIETSITNLNSFKNRFEPHENTLKSFDSYFRDVVPTLVTKKDFNDYSWLLTDLQKNVNKIRDLPEGFSESFGTVVRFVAVLKEARDLVEMSNSIGSLQRRMDDYDKSGGNTFETRLKKVEEKRSLTEQEVELLSALPKDLLKLKEITRAVVTVVNESNASNPEFRPIAFAEADCFGDIDQDYTINGFVVSCVEWLETLPLQGIECVYRKKLLAELRAGRVSPIGKEWLKDWNARYDRKVVGTVASERFVPEEEFFIGEERVPLLSWLERIKVDGGLDVKRRRLIIDQRKGYPLTVVSREWIHDLQLAIMPPEIEPEADVIENACDLSNGSDVGTAGDVGDVGSDGCENDGVMVHVRQGSIPHRKELSECLGYTVGKGRIWLTPAECFHVLSHWMISLWIWFCHPNVDFTGQWDVWRTEYEEAGKPILRSICQADVIEDTKDEAPVVGGTVKMIDKQLEYVEQLEVPGNLHANQRVIMAGKNAVSNTMTASYIIWKRGMTELYSANGPFVQMFGPTGMLQGGLSLHLRLNLTPLAGLGLLVGYAEGGDVGVTMDYATAISYPHVIWNPACEDSCLFEFFVNSCVDHWHPSFLLGHPGVVFMLMISNWSPAPPHNMAFSWKISYEPKITVDRDVVTPMKYVGEYRGNWVSMTFKPNSSTLAVAEHFNLAYPSLQGGLIYSFWETLLGMYHYWRGDVLMQVHKLSSPMVAGTFGCALVPGLKIPKMSSSYLQSIPHVEFTLGMTECRKKFVFPSHLFGFAGATERMNLNRNSVKNDMAFAVWMFDSPTGNKDVSEYILGFEVLGLENCEVMGFNAGYPVTPARFLNSKSQSQAVPERMVVRRDEQSAMAYQVPATMYPYSGNVPAILQNDTEWFHCLSWTPSASHVFGVGKHDFVMFDLYRMCLYELHGKSHALVIPSPFVRLMQSSCWIKGTMRFKLVWAAPEVKVADWDSSLRISVYNDEVMSYRRHHHVATTRGGEHVFTVTAGGCFGGFYPQLYHTLIKKDAPQLVVQVIGSKMAYWELYVQVGADFQVAGVSGSVMAQPTIAGPNPAYDVPIDF